MNFIINKKNIFQLSYLGIFFMYFNFIPISGESQPIFVLFGVILGSILAFATPEGLKISRDSLFLIIHISIIIIYMFIHMLSGGRDFLEFFRLIIGPIMYIIVLKNVQYINIVLLKRIILLIIFLFVVQYFKIPIFVNILDYIYKAFIPRSNIFGLGSRGIAVLVPEPSYFSYISMILLYSIDYIWLYKKDFLSKNEFLILKTSIIVISLFTRSTLVYIFLILYSLQYFKIRYIKFLVFIGLILIFFSLILNIENLFVNNRFFEIFTKFLSLSDSNIIDVLFYSDSSAGSRLIINFIYIISALLYPLGMGIGIMRKEWFSIAQFFEISVDRNILINEAINNTQNLNSQAYLPHLIGTIGFLSIFIFLFIFKRNKILILNLEKKSLSRNIKISLFFFLLILQSNMVNPVFWILIGIVKDIETRKP